MGERIIVKVIGRRHLPKANGQTRNIYCIRELVLVVFDLLGFTPETDDLLEIVPREVEFALIFTGFCASPFGKPAAPNVRCKMQNSNGQAIKSDFIAFFCYSDSFFSHYLLCRS
jgi:hypothetical protein